MAVQKPWAKPAGNSAPRVQLAASESHPCAAPRAAPWQCPYLEAFFAKLLMMA